MADAKGIRAGSAFVELFADDAALQKGLKAAEASVKNFGMSVGKIGASIAGLGAAITAPMIAAAHAFAEGGSALAHMSERTGMSVEALSTLGYAAKQSGTDLEGVETGIRRMQKAMTAGSLENQQAAQTFQNLGLNIQQLMRLKPDEQFKVMAERIAAIQNPAVRAGAAMMIFGRSGTALLPMIEHLGALSKEARDFGLVSSTEAAEGALKLEHSMKLLDAITKKIFTTIGSALAPSFEAWNMALAKVEKSVLDLVKANKPLIVTISMVGFALVAAGTAITTLGVAIFGLGQIIGAVSAVIGMIGAVLGLLLTPLGLVAVGFAATTTAMGKWGEAGAVVANLMKTNFGGMLQTAKDTFAGISDALKAGDIALAAQVLWAGLKLEFIKGSQLVESVWSDFTGAIIREMTVLNTDLASLWVDMWASLETIATKAARKLSGILGMIFPDDPRISAAQEADSWQKTLDDIEKNRKGTQDVLSGDLEAGAAERDKANRARQAQAEDELFQAEMELAKQKKKAADEAAGPIGTAEGGMGKGPGAGAGEPGEGMTPEGLDKGLKEAAAKVDVSGSFSAAAAAGMGVGQSIEKQQVDEQKKTNDHLAKLNKKAEAGRLTFAD